MAAGDRGSYLVYHGIDHSMLLDGHTTERLLLRKVVAADFDTWLPFYDDPESTRYWKGIPHVKRKACTDQFDRIFERYDHKLGGMNALILKEGQRLIGLCGLLLQTVDGFREWEIGYSLLPESRGKGFATEAAAYCKEAAFGCGLARSLISIIHVDNVPSQAVAIRIGMVREKETIYKQNPVYIYRIDQPS